MTAALDEAALRHWLADYLVTNVGCSPDDIDFDASMSDLGLGSRDAVVLSGELSELLGQKVSPVEFWQHPTIGDLARFLSSSELDAEPVIEPDRGSADEPIAVIGLGCRFPGEIAGPESLWQFMREGRSAVSEVPPERWKPFDDGSAMAAAALSDTTRWGSFLAEIDAFDAEFFEISPREAAKMDPQQRLLLEVAHEAFEHAGITTDSLRHSQTGVFVGSCLGEYGYLASTDLSQVDAWTGTGGALSIIANRVSYFFDLRGPSVTVDTACSSSLVAVHLAAQSLRSGESNLAIAAGVNLLLSPAVTRSFDQAEAMSPTGQCHAFDADADGFVRGEGCGVVVLKRLSDALRDGDSVLAVVRGSAVNQDGRSNGLMAPNPAAQIAVLRAAYANAGVPTHEVDYVEAHGTGTLLGDPIEARALGTVLGRGRPQDAPLLVGAVKSNLGHLEAAAGVAGLIKTVLALQKAQIPANLNFRTPNPHIPFAKLQMKVVAEQQDWPQTERPRRAGVSSFGFGGTNAHVVLEQAPAPRPVESAPEPAVSTLVLSAKTPARIALTASRLAEWMAGEGAGVPLVDVTHTVNSHRTRYKSYAAVCARDSAQTIAGLRALAANEPAEGVVEPSEKPHGSGTVFLYSGQGSQWAGMGRQLLADEPAFAAAVAELEPDFIAQVGFSLRDVLDAGEPVVGIERIQPVLVGMQLALTALWRSYGVEPDAVIGHSMGEVTAAVVAGALSPADGLKVIATRSRLMSQLSGQGAMALLELDAAEAEKLVADYSDITVAVYAAPQQTVIAGPPEQVDAVVEVVDAQGLLARRVEVDVASHHPTVDPILAELRSALADLAPVSPTIPLISTVGQTDGVEPVFDADYWVVNLRNPVRFSQAVTAAFEEYGNHTFVEVSPHPLLIHAVGETLRSVSSGEGFVVTPAMKRGDDETLSVHIQLATLGVTDPTVGRRRLTDIPTSPWQHQKYWIEQKPAKHRLPDVHPLLGVHIEMPSGREHVWQADIEAETMPWLATYQVQGQAVLSAASFAEMALAAGRLALKLPIDALQVSELALEQLLVLDRQTRITTQLAHEADGYRVELHADSADGSWSRYAVARLDTTQADASAGQPDAEPGTEVELLYDAVDHPEYCIHPVLLDAALGQLAAAIPESTDGSDGTQHLPVSIATIRVFASIGRRARCRVDLVERDDGYDGRIVIRDDTGTVVAELTGIELRPVDPRTMALPLEQKTFDTEWVASAIPVLDSAPSGSWLLLTEPESGTASETASFPAEFAARLASPTRRVVSAELSDETGVVEAVAKTAADADRPPAGVIVFLGPPSFDGTDIEGALGRAQGLIWAISAAAGAIIDSWPGKLPRLWVITRDGLSVRDDEPGDPAIGALKGLIRNWRFPGEAARVLAGEPDFGAALVDLDGSLDLHNVVTSLLSELQSSAADDVIAWREGSRYVERLCRASLDGSHQDATVRADGSYIVTGGLGGLGTVVTRWLVERGAGRLVLNGRSEPSDDQRKALAGLATSTEIVYLAGDIAAPEVADRLVAAAEETGQPLRGVVHGAGVTGDGLVTALTRDGMARVWAPKVNGALRLHDATAARDLDWWVGFSSMATLLGLPGQLAYTTANAWLDALVAWRRASGLPATSINWGQWSDVGMSRALTYSVLDPITPDEGVEALQYLVGGGLGRVGVGRLRLDRAVAAIPEFRDLGFFEKLVSEFDRTSDIARADAQATVDDLDQSALSIPDWSQLSADDRLSELELRLRTMLGRELRMSASAINADQPFPELGLDSMMAMAVLRATRKRLGIDVSANMLFNHPTVSSLAAYLADLLAPREVAQKDTADVASDSAGSVLDELFDSVESASAGSESGTF